MSADPHVNEAVATYERQDDHSALKVQDGITFEQFLDLHGDQKAEWVSGKVFAMEPPSEEHENTASFLAAVGRVYAEETDSGRVLGDGYSEQVSAERVRVPDVAFFRKSNLGKLERTHSIGAADLIIEVLSPSTAATDRGAKFYEYEAAGVEEYWLVDPERKTAEFHRLVEGRYQPVLPDAEGKVYSSTMPGFFLRVSWLWERPKITTVLRELGVI